MLDKKGYTLIELIVVVVLIGLSMTLMAPRLRSNLLTDDLKGAARKLIGVITHLRNEAIRDQKDYALCFDMNSNCLWVESQSMSDEEKTEARENATPLPADVYMDDIWIRGEGKKADGEPRIWFTRKGYIQMSAIHLSTRDNRHFTMELRPFSGKVKVIEKYVDFE